MNMNSEYWLETALYGSQNPFVLDRWETDDDGNIIEAWIIVQDEELAGIYHVHSSALERVATNEVLSHLEKLGLAEISEDQLFLDQPGADYCLQLVLFGEVVFA